MFSQQCFIIASIRNCGVFLHLQGSLASARRSPFQWDVGIRFDQASVAAPVPGGSTYFFLLQKNRRVDWCGMSAPAIYQGLCLKMLEFFILHYYNQVDNRWHQFQEVVPERKEATKNTVITFLESFEELSSWSDLEMIPQPITSGYLDRSATIWVIGIQDASLETGVSPRCTKGPVGVYIS